MHRIISRCQTCCALAARGSRPRPRSRTATGPEITRLSKRLRRCAHGLDCGQRPLHLAGMVAPALRQTLHESLLASRRLAIFTGAGLSTESGVPDFRTRARPGWQTSPFPSTPFSRVRRRAVRPGGANSRWMTALPARNPRRCITLLADFVREGRAIGLITQNIDGLHQEAGTVPVDRLVELHGNGTYATCLDCGMRHELHTIRPVFETTGRARALRGLRWPGEERDHLLRPAHAGSGDATGGSMVAAGGSVSRHRLVPRGASRRAIAACRQGQRRCPDHRQPGGNPLDQAADLVVRGEIGAAFAGLSVQGTGRRIPTRLSCEKPCKRGLRKPSQSMLWLRHQ